MKMKAAKKRSKPIVRPQGLRQRAERLLAKTPREVAQMTPPDVQELVHELQVHQIELEMQNEELRRVQLELETSRDRFSALYDFSPVGYVTLNAKGVIQEANLTAAHLLGASHEHLVARKLTAFIARESQDAFYLYRQLVFNSRIRQVCELQMRRKDGSTFFAGLESMATRDGRPQPQEWLVAFSDITASRQKQADRLRDVSSLAEENPDPVLRIGANGILYYANAASAPVLAAWNCRPERPVPAEWQDIIRAVLERGTVQERETAVVGLTFSCTLVPFKERGYVNFYARDITGRKLLDAALRQSHALLEDRVRERTAELEASNAALKKSEQELAKFFNTSPMGLLWADPKGRILRANQALLELFGCAAGEVLGRPVAQFHADREIADDVLRRLTKDETVQNHRARMRRKDGNLWHALVDANGLWEKKRLVHSRWFVRDITRRVELEREIVGIGEREQRRLGHDLHDDLCQQLAGIEFLSQTLAADLADRAAAEVGQAKEIAQLARRAMEQTRELARGLSPVGMEAEGLMDGLRGLAAHTRKVFRCECRFACEAPVLVPDPAVGIHLYRIAQEAVGNAIKHGKAGRIDIGLTANDSHVVLAVRDNGLGLPKKSRKQKGMGLRVMQYRAGVIGGSLLVQRKPNGGTEVVCTVQDGLLPPKKLGTP